MKKDRFFNYGYFIGATICFIISRCISGDLKLILRLTLIPIIGQILFLIPFIMYACMIKTIMIGISEIRKIKLNQNNKRIIIFVLEIIVYIIYLIPEFNK